MSLRNIHEIANCRPCMERLSLAALQYLAHQEAMHRGDLPSTDDLMLF